MKSDVMMLLSSSISAYLYVLCYSRISNQKLKYNIKNILLILLQGLIFIINTYYLSNIGMLNNIILNVITLTLTYYWIYNDNLSETFIRGIVMYIIMVLYEIIFSLFVTLLNVFSVSAFNKSMLIKTVFSALILLSTYATLSIKAINRFCDKIVARSSNKVPKILLIMGIVFVVVIDMKYTVTFERKVYFINIILGLCFVGVVSICVYANHKSMKEMDKIDTLLEFMAKYEKAIDKDRINRHEMLNNLLLLRSFKNRNSKEFEETINDLIETYNNKNIKPIKNVFTLPQGLKGIIYYKMKDAEMDNINFNVKISPKVASVIKKINNKDYTKLCKIIGITLDNANEAAKASKKKLVLVEAYEINKEVHIVISNTCKNKVDLENIDKKNYSSKGKNRGLGLYIANTLLKESNNITMTRSFQNYIFTTEIIAK